MKIIELKADMRNVDVRFRVISKGEPREITTRDGKVLRLSEVEVGDDTGRIYLTLWDKSIDELEEGEVGEVRNGFIKVIRNELRLNVGKYGELVKIEETGEFIETESIPGEFPKPDENYRPKHQRKRFKR